MKTSSWLLVILILLIGTFLRTNDIDQIPPGLYHDEAYSGLDALGIVRGAGFPIFFEGNGGREPFFIYLHALSIWLFGISPFALRIPAAFLGILTLPVLFSLIRAIAASSKDDITLALTAIAGLATSYWHLNFSRVGWRTISLPLFACLTFYFFWRCRRTHQFRDQVLTGVFLGASLYTYLSARFLPIVLALFWLIELVGMIRARFASSSWRTWLSHIVPIIAVAVVVFLPLAIYFLDNPEAFLFRVTDVTLPSEPSLVNTLWSNMQRVVVAFYQSGDPEWRHGIVYRPILDWVIGLPFAIGLIVTIWKCREPRNYFALLWLGIMLLPTILSRDAPDTQRAIGALPVMYLFVAWGVGHIAQFLGTRFRFVQLRIALAMLVLLLFGGGWITYRDYFMVWANDRHAYDDFQGNLADFARWMNQQSTNVFLPMELYAEPTVYFLSLSHTRTTSSVLGMDASPRQKILSDPGFVIVPAEHTKGNAVLVRNDSVVLLDQVASSAGTASHSLTTWKDRWGRSFASMETVSDARSIFPTDLAQSQFLSAEFEHSINLVGYKIEKDITPGKPIDAEFYWSAFKPIQEDVSLFVHLLDSHSQVVFGVNEYPANGYKMNLWQSGLVIPDQHHLSTDSALAPGKYSVEVGFYRPSNGSRLLVWVDPNREPDDRIIIAPFKIAAKADSTILPQNLLTVRFADAIQLSGYTLDLTGLEHNSPIRLKLFWQALRRIDRDYTVFVHLLDGNNKIIAQMDQQPLSGTYPTSIWDPSENVQDEITLKIPNNVPAGLYKLELGLYDTETSTRLLLLGANDSVSTDALVLQVNLKIGSK